MPQRQYGVVLSHYNIKQILLGENLIEEMCFLFSEISDETKFPTTAISQIKRRRPSLPNEFCSISDQCVQYVT